MVDDGVLTQIELLLTIAMTGELLGSHGSLGVRYFSTQVHLLQRLSVYR